MKDDENLAANGKSEVAQKEEEILKFWREKEIFKKSLEKPSARGEFVFYEGPPTANARPALHHLEARAFKDVIPRFKTMMGFHVPRKGGWDTHGLPVEIQIEKKLGIKSKKEIEKHGIAKFNRECKESVFEYISDWEIFSDRIAYWIDKENAYYTFNPTYIESIWHILKKVNDRKLLYKDYKVVPWCPRCGTALSSHELAQGYQDDKDLSVTVKFKVAGQENLYLLSWTTTPWTLPGNVALAVDEKIIYSKIKKNNECLILAKERLSSISETYEVVEEIKGKDLVGLKYEPLYPYLKEKFESKDTEAFEKSYQVYAAPFVNTEEGTGIVHTAVMYGQDDFELGTKIGLPKFHLVQEDGNFAEGTDFLAGRFVKDESVAVDIIKDLSRRGLLFSKEKYEHSYPHCWRCKTPLIYYARDSWYIKMSELRDDLVKENEKINWIPSHIKDGRFGEWLREVKDWAISRERYWGTPLPFWVNEKGGTRVIGSIDELKKYTKKSGNKYFVMRHGEGEHNVSSIVSSRADDPIHLTEKGRKEAESAALELDHKKIDVIYASPFLRTKETVAILRKYINLPESQVIYDERLREFDAGSNHGKKFDFGKYFNSLKSFDTKIEDGESPLDVRRRAAEFLYEINEKNQNKNILIVTHGIFFEVIDGIINGWDFNKSLNFLRESVGNFKTGEFKTYDFIPLPHDENYELDLHRPYIDEIELEDKDGKLNRVKEVLDVWFDSGGMPFAQDHYPFSTQKLIYPADFISEAIDQTRGWFYTLHAIGVLMEEGKAYKNVICLGHILDAEGKKMSKSVGNVVNPTEMIDKYGVDSLRMWMYSVNAPGDSKNFNEKTLDEIYKKLILRLENAVAFLEMYGSPLDSDVVDFKGNVLDDWIVSRLIELRGEVTKNLENYELEKASRPIFEFVDDFSTWYIRRSRDRFRSHENLSVRNPVSRNTGFVLLVLSELIAPFMPFLAEEIYQKVKLVEGTKAKESVHLENWPELDRSNLKQEVLDKMKVVRKIVSLALEKRMSAGIKVRQPLSKLKVKSEKLKISDEEYLDLIKDEINIKEIEFVDNLDEGVWLDIEITPKLQAEGNIRDFIRAVQELRKEKNLTPDQKITLLVETSQEGKKFLESSKSEISKPTNISNFEFVENNGMDLKIENYKLKIQI